MLIAYPHNAVSASAYLALNKSFMMMMMTMMMTTIIIIKRYLSLT